MYYIAAQTRAQAWTEEESRNWYSRYKAASKRYTGLTTEEQTQQMRLWHQEGLLPLRRQHTRGGHGAYKGEGRILGIRTYHLKLKSHQVTKAVKKLRLADPEIPEFDRLEEAIFQLPVVKKWWEHFAAWNKTCLLYTSPSPRDRG